MGLYDLRAGRVVLDARDLIGIQRRVAEDPSVARDDRHAKAEDRPRLVRQRIARRLGAPR